MLFVLLLAWWPFVYHYTSVGLDFEQRVDGGVDGIYWRVRWPSDGSIVLARIVHRTKDVGDTLQPVDAFDFGGTFLKPAQATDGETFFENLGFWCRSVDAREAKVPDAVKDAERAFLIGVPHVLLALLTGGLWWFLRQRRRAKTGRKPMPGDGTLSNDALGIRAADRQSSAGPP